MHLLYSLLLALSATMSASYAVAQKKADPDASQAEKRAASGKAKDGLIALLSDPAAAPERVRKLAAELHEESDARAVVEAAKKRFRDSDRKSQRLRIHLITVMAALGPRAAGAVPLLIPTATSEYKEESEAARKAVLAIGIDETAARVFCPQMKDYESMTDEAFAAFTAALVKTTDKRVRGIAIKYLEDTKKTAKDPKRRAEASKILKEWEK